MGLRDILVGNTQRLNEDRLGKGIQDIHKVARGDRKIKQVQNAVEQYVKNHTDIEIKSHFVCVGTNDIRHNQESIDHLKPVMCDPVTYSTSAGAWLERW